MPNTAAPWAAKILGSRSMVSRRSLLRSGPDAATLRRTASRAERSASAHPAASCFGIGQARRSSMLRPTILVRSPSPSMTSGASSARRSCREIRPSNIATCCGSALSDKNLRTSPGWRSSKLFVTKARVGVWAMFFSSKPVPPAGVTYTVFARTSVEARTLGRKIAAPASAETKARND